MEGGGGRWMEVREVEGGGTDGLSSGISEWVTGGMRFRDSTVHRIQIREGGPLEWNGLFLLV